MKKKIAALALVVLLLVAAVVGGTLAYFTDTDSATNTFTVGDVDIELVEKMQDPEHESVLLDWAPHELVPGGLYPYSYAPNLGWENKLVFVKNTGENDAYVRVKFRYERALEPVLHIESYFNGLAEGEKYYETIDGIEYVVETLYAIDPVKAGYYFGVRDELPADQEPTAYDMYDHTFIDMVWLDTTFDWFNKDYGWFSYGTGDDKTVVMCDYGMPNFEVTVIAEAIQADSFDNYEEAFAAFDAQA